MFDFQIQLNQQLSGISSRDANVTTEAISASQETPNYDSQAFETIRRIEQQMRDFQTMLNNSLALIQSSTKRLAIEVANAVIQDDDLTEKRVVFLAEAALAMSDDTQTRQIVVHPDCEPAIGNWLAEAGASFSIKTDQSMTPGDCRIEQGETGVLASLENYLIAAYQKINAMESLAESAGA